MSGRLRLILGRADTGKSARVVAALKAHQSAGERAILLVPEHYTYEAERLLADAAGRDCAGRPPRATPPLGRPAFRLATA